jgi:hypothetical protein
MVQTKRMDKTVRRYTNFDDMKSDEYRYWQSQSVQARFDAVEEMIQAAYAIKGWKIEPESGLMAFVISREDLIDAKLAAGRPQDLADVDAIQRATASLDSPGTKGEV